jgi:hypothetical protein
VQPTLIGHSIYWVYCLGSLIYISFSIIDISVRFAENCDLVRNIEVKIKWRCQVKFNMKRDTKVNWKPRVYLRNEVGVGWCCGCATSCATITTV